MTKTSQTRSSLNSLLSLSLVAFGSSCASLASQEQPGVTPADNQLTEATATKVAALEDRLEIAFDMLRLQSERTEFLEGLLEQGPGSFRELIAQNQLLFEQQLRSVEEQLTKLSELQPSEGALKSFWDFLEPSVPPHWLTASKRSKPRFKLTEPLESKAFWSDAIESLFSRL